MRVYLDTSVLNRPFDDQTQPRIWYESLGLALVLAMVEEGVLDLVSSTALELENLRNPFSARQRWVAECLSKATHHEAPTRRSRVRARQLQGRGLGSLDATHVSLAEQAGCVFLVTCDDRLIRRAPAVDVKVVSPDGLLQRLQEVAS